MGLFDNPNDNDIVQNANGTSFQYDLAENKWVIIGNVAVYTEAEVDALIADFQTLAEINALIAATNHDTLLNPNGNAEEQHLTSAQQTALHTRVHTMVSVDDHHQATTHKIFYTDASGHVVELALGADGEVLTSTGAATAPAFEAAGGAGLSGTTQYMQLELYETTDAIFLEGYAKLPPAKWVFASINVNNSKIDSGEDIIFHMQFKTNWTDANYSLRLLFKAHPTGDNPNAWNIENSTVVTTPVTNALLADYSYTIANAGFVDDDMLYMGIHNNEVTAYMYIYTAWIEYTHV